MTTLTEGAIDAAQLRSNKRKLAILLIIPFVVLASAYIVFYTGVGIPTSTTNRGELISPPVQVLEADYQSIDGNVYAFSALWHMMIPVSNDCADACLDSLITTRQVHLRQGKRAIDIDRVIVATEPLAPDLVTQIQAAHPRASLVIIDPQLMDQIVQTVGYTQGDYYLVDPRGWLMMAYRDQHTGEDLLKDLKKLLK